jgi:tRNA (guanosine-2'-O-)-methyltransferase
VHWVGRDVASWLDAQRTAGSIIVAVELADEASRLVDQTPARRVEIPMVGTGASLNVAVAGSLVLYRLAGLI